MAFSKKTKTNDGEVVLDAYWVPVQKNTGISEHSGFLLFYPYRSKELRHAKAAALQGPKKEYIIGKDEFMALQMQPITNMLPEYDAVMLDVVVAGVTVKKSLGQIIREQPRHRYYDIEAGFCYKFAKDKKDTTALDAAGKPVMIDVLDKDGKVIMREKRDANGAVVMQQKTGANGVAMVDANGQPVMEPVMESVKVPKMVSFFEDATNV